MAKDSGFIPVSGPIKASCIRKARQSSNCSGSSDVFSACSCKDFFCTNASMPELGAGTPLNFSEFREASILTVSVKSFNETHSTYGTNNNGQFRVVFNCDSVVTDGSGIKEYAFDLNNDGTFQSQCENTASPNHLCRERYRGSLNGTVTYNFKVQDGLNDACTQIRNNIVVTYNGGSREKNNIQQVNNQF